MRQQCYFHGSHFIVLFFFSCFVLSKNKDNSSRTSYSAWKSEIGLITLAEHWVCSTDPQYKTQKGIKNEKAYVISDFISIVEEFSNDISNVITTETL